MDASTDTTTTAPDDSTTIDPRHARVRRLAWLLDQSIEVPLLRRRIGVDGLIGLVPGVGDAAGALLSAYLIVLAHRLGAPTRLKFRMVGIVATELLVGVVPVLGDLFDFAYKSNARIAKLLDEHLTQAGTQGGTDSQRRT